MGEGVREMKMVCGEISIQYIQRESMRETQRRKGEKSTSGQKKTERW